MHPFVGRRPELAALHGRLAGATAGRPQVVQIQGPAGIGKTALVERFLSEIRPQVVRASGEEAETLLAYGVVDQLARSAGTAGPLGTSVPGPGPLADPVTVGRRVLDLLDGLERAGPVVVVLDDGHWADLPSLQALIFALRRLVADQVLALVVVRDDAVAELPESLRRLVSGHSGSVLRLRGLDEQDLSDLAEEMGLGTFPAPAAQRLRYGTQGNPLHARALLEEFPPSEWGAADQPLPSPRSFRLLVQDRYSACAEDTRRLVDAAAVLGMRCSLPLAAALGEVAQPVQAVDEATGRDLLVASVGQHPWTLSFPHPLVRSAVHDALGPARCSTLHAAAAALVDDEVTVLHHRVAAAPAPDAALARDLAEFADREARRQAWPSAAAHLVGSARLTPDREDGRRRLLRAVTWMLQTGDAASAAAHAEGVRRFPPSPQRDSVLGSLAMARGDPAAAEDLLGSAWKQCGPETDSEVAATIALQHAVHRYGRLDGAGTVEWSHRALELTRPGTDTDWRARTYLAHALGFTGRTSESFAATEGADGDAADPGYGWLQPRSARGQLRLVEDDLDGARADLTSVAATASELGVLNTTAFAFGSLARAEYLAGDWDDAVLHAERAVAVGVESEYGFTHWMVLGISALVPAARGEWTTAEAVLSGLPLRYPGDYERSVVAIAMTRARLAEARGDPEGVLAALEPVPTFPFRDAVDEPGFWAWGDLYVEALVATGRTGEADTLLGEHEKQADERGRLSSIARLARARGRVEAAAGRPEQAEVAFARALDASGRVAFPFERARIELAAGQFLRRAGQRRRAAELLTAARAGFDALGAVPYSERCTTELAASGLRPTARVDRDRTALTSQELVVARLAAAGRTNREVAGELVVSVKTVEYHLRNAFQKLGITRRRQLAGRLAELATR